jgi:hypothetical protein
MSAHLAGKDTTPERACIDAPGRSQEAAPLGVRVVENLRQVASTDKEQI